MDLPAINRRDALNYLSAVKYKIGKEKHDEFLDAVKHVDIARVQQLLANEHHLIIGFNAYLANGMQIPVPAEPPAQKPSEQDAISFVEKLRQRRPQQHSLFLEIFGKYKKQLIAVRHVYQQVELLLHNEDDADLMEDFRLFLPPEAFHPIANPIDIHNNKKNNHKKSTKNSAASLLPPPLDDDVEKVDNELPIVDRLRRKKRPRVKECVHNKDENELVHRHPVELEEAIEFAHNLKRESLQGQYHTDYFNLMLDVLRPYRANCTSLEDVHQRLGMLLQHDHPELLSQLEAFLPASYRAVRVNPSYRLILNEDSDGGDEDAGVVNNVCCSVMRKVGRGNYCKEDVEEDKLYLLDMMLKTLPHTIGKLQKLWSAQEKTGDDRMLIECLDSTSIMCIKRYMGEKGAEYVKLNARHAPPIILPVLKKKLKYAANEKAKMEQGLKRQNENANKRGK